MAEIAAAQALRNEILQQVWGAVPYVLERTVDVHIARIRAKLGEKRALVQNNSGGEYMGFGLTERYDCRDWS